MVSIKWTYYDLSNQYSIDLHFFQIFTNINYSLMNFSMHVPFHNCAVVLEKFLEVTFLSANSLKISNKKKESLGHFEKYTVSMRLKLNRFSHLKQINIAQCCCLPGVVFQ